MEEAFRGPLEHAHPINGIVPLLEIGPQREGGLGPVIVAEVDFSAIGNGDRFYNHVYLLGGKATSHPGHHASLGRVRATNIVS